MDTQKAQSRNIDSAKRNKVKEENVQVVHNKVISELDSSIKGTPHSLIELSNKQWDRISSDSIIVQEYTKAMYYSKDKNTSYGKVTYSTNIIIRRRKGGFNNKKFQWKTPLLCNIDGGFIVIVAKKGISNQ